MTLKRLLIVDDEPDIRELLEITLGRMQLETVSAANLQQALNYLDTQSFDLCLTDMHLPDGSGLTLIEHISEHHSHLPVAMITAFGSVDTAITALKAGAFDFLQKPIDLEQLRNLVSSALRIGELTTVQPDQNVNLIGDSSAMVNLREQIKKISRSQAPIYVSGESGSGKEVAARLVHAMGPRAAGPFVPVNCGAIPSELMESEFFGHVKGSFTGAVSDKQGLFQAATGGTLFLDEVADLPLVMQVKLLRAIQEKAVRPVGAQTEEKTEVRVLSATHKNLLAEVNAGRFRQDLYYRLNVIELRIPSLREHVEDIPALAQASLQRLAEQYSAPPPKVSSDALALLMNYSFPGNVRELENFLERAFTLCEGNLIRPEDLQLNQLDELRMGDVLEVNHARAGEHSPTSADPELNHQPTQTPIPPSEYLDLQAVTPTELLTLPEGISLEHYLESIERILIAQALDTHRWNKTSTAKSLGMTFRALRYKIQKLNLE